MHGILFIIDHVFVMLGMCRISALVLKRTMSSTLIVFEVAVLGCKFCSVLFDIQFLNDFASVNSK